MIVHTPIADVAGAAVAARRCTRRVTDNLGVNPASVTVDWTLNAVPQTPFTSRASGLTNNYSGAVPGAGAVVPGDVVTYHITAPDVAAVPEHGPQPGESASIRSRSSPRSASCWCWTTTRSRSAPRPRWSTTRRPARARTGAARDRRRRIRAVGERHRRDPQRARLRRDGRSRGDVEPGDLAELRASWCRRAAPTPARSRTRRTARRSRATSRPGTSCWSRAARWCTTRPPPRAIRRSPRNVLHAGTWAADDAGKLLRLAAQASHPIANMPNVLPATLPIAFVGYGRRGLLHAGRARVHRLWRHHAGGQRRDPGLRRQRRSAERADRGVRLRLQGARRPHAADPAAPEHRGVPAGDRECAGRGGLRA